MLGLPMIPIFAFALGGGMLCLGSFLMQIAVQGAWGVIPAHLTEMSPDAIRGFYPGVTYQLGNCLAAFNLPIQQRAGRLARVSVRVDGDGAPVLVVMVLLTFFGKEAKGVEFGTITGTAAVTTSR